MLMAGILASALAWSLPVLTLTRSVSPVSLSCTNTSAQPLLSPATRSAAYDMKATKRPSGLIAG